MEGAKGVSFDPFWPSFSTKGGVSRSLQIPPQAGGTSCKGVFPVESRFHDLHAALPIALAAFLALVAVAADDPGGGD